MKLPVFGKAKFPREEMERVAAQELAAALESVPQPPDPSLSVRDEGWVGAADPQPTPSDLPAEPAAPSVNR